MKLLWDVNRQVKTGDLLADKSGKKSSVLLMDIPISEIKLVPRLITRGC